MIGPFTLYLDGSGHRGWPGETKRATEYYVMAGLILHPTMDLALRTRIRELLARHFSDMAEPPRSLPHCSDVMGRTDICKGWSETESRNFAGDVFGLIRVAGPWLMGTVVKKRPLRKKYGSKAERVYLYALRATIARYDVQLEEWNCPGQVIVDSEEEEEPHALNAIRSWREVGTRYSERAKTTLNQFLRQVLNTVIFVTDEDSPGVQLADWVANSTFGYYESGRTETFAEIQPLWRKFGLNRSEPVVLPGTP